MINKLMIILFLNNLKLTEQILSTKYHKFIWVFILKSSQH